MYSDQQLPNGQNDKAQEHNAADHSQQDHHGVRSGAAFWFFEDSDVGLPTAKFRVGKLHHTVLHWIGAQDGVWIISLENIHSCNDLISAVFLAGLVIGQSS